ncbi:hypothetical protein M3A49_41825 [Paraburkholderia sp. CNPSo 3076]|nr:hypothetical protein [Paraburkholderia sp. CNPSo 3076]
MEAALQAVVRHYDRFLDEELLPAQKQYADILDTFQGWREGREPELVDTLMEEFREFPCMNDPTESITEQILRREGCYPKFLCVVADAPSCVDMAHNNSLSYLDEKYRFEDENGNQRMLAYDIMPYEDEFDYKVVRNKYQALGCELRLREIKRCILIPETDLMRDEGGHFWSRPYFGKFDVAAYARADIL